MTISIENALERLLHARSNRGPVAPLSRHMAISRSSTPMASKIG